MNHTPSVRTIRERIHEHARSGIGDMVAREALRTDVRECVHGLRRAIDRAVDFAERGLVSEAASVVEDFPDLARQAEALRVLPSRDPAIARVWNEQIDTEPLPLPLPTPTEIDQLLSILMRAEEHRALLDAMRVSALRGEPVVVRLKILRKLRAVDGRNLMWLRQIEVLEEAWLRQISDLRHRDASMAELDEALLALGTHEWIATVPRGLKDELLEKVRPLRAQQAEARYEALAGQIHDAQSRMDRAELLRLEQAWASVNHETGREPDAALADSVSPAFQWLGQLEEEEQAQQLFQGEVDRLESLLQSRRPVTEVEAQVARLHDSGRPCPDGLLERARSYCDAEHERVRRRHRLVIVGSVLAAALLLGIGIVVLRAHSEASRIDADTQALRALLDEKAIDRAHELAEAIRARGKVPSAELAALLEEEAKAFAASEARRQEIVAFLDASELELEREATRARLAALDAVIRASLADAKDAERARLSALDALRLGMLAKLDDADDRESKAALEQLEKDLKAWPVPGAWTDAQQVSPERWGAYIAGLEEGLRLLEEASRSADGHEPSVARIDLRRNGLRERLDEARSRDAELAAALEALGIERLCAPITSEQQFVERLDGLLGAHAPVLARLGLMRDFEAARDAGPSMLAIEAWRKDARPRLAALLGRNLSVVPEPAAAAEALGILRAFRDAHPGSPMETALSALEQRLDAGAGGPLWTAEKMQSELAAAFFSGLHEVPLRDGRYYRRPRTGPGVQDVDIFFRVVRNIAELPEAGDKLRAIGDPKIEARVQRRVSEPSEVSVAWGRAEAALAQASGAEVSMQMLDLIAALRRMEKCDPIFQFRALKRSVELLRQSGRLPQALEKPFAEWSAMVGRDAPEAVVADFLVAGYSDTQESREARSQAMAAIRAFPDIAQVQAREAEAARRTVESLSEHVPVGFLAPAEPSQAARRAVGLRAGGEHFILVRQGGGFALMPLGVQPDAPSVLPAGASSGPIVIYRRNNAP